MPSDILAEWLRCEDPQQSRQLFSTLLWEHAAPLVRAIIGRRISSEKSAAAGYDGEDVCNDVLAQIIHRLQELKSDPGQDPIRDFRGYVAVAAYHGCDEYLRRKYPQRHRLKNKIRYVIGKQPCFSLAEDAGGEWHCSRRPGRGSRELVRSGRAESDQLAGFIAAAVDESSGRISFDDLVDRIAGRVGVAEEEQLGDSDRAAMADPSTGAADNLEQRSWLKSLWNEIRELPWKQRAALLLNLRDHQGGPAITLLPITGIANLREIAAALEMRPEELAALWNELPLDDNVIADRVSSTRQQVINLRRSARERLSRKMEPLA